MSYIEEIRRRRRDANPFFAETWGLLCHPSREESA